MGRQTSLPETSHSFQTSDFRHDLEVVDEDSMNQAYVCSQEATEKPKPSFIIGPGGVPIPQLNHLKHLAPNGNIRVMCLTWNMASRKRTKIKHYLWICPLSNRLSSKYHHEAVQILSDSLRDTHIVFCWVRKWTQMLLIFIRSELIRYASRKHTYYFYTLVTETKSCNWQQPFDQFMSLFFQLFKAYYFICVNYSNLKVLCARFLFLAPEWQFISTSVIVKPLRTKGAIQVSFQLFQITLAFVACHLSYGPLVHRRNDYSKIIDALKLDQDDKGKHYLDGIFWFGDLNFRILSRQRFDELQESTVCENPNRFFADLLADDELTIEKTKGEIFGGFIEPTISFPPTHKFVVGTNDYAFNRIPSYTDRVLYFSKDSSRILPIVYDSLWEESSSDHKPVYAVFNVRVTDSCN
uniref:IPPc domain-containing protein n=1 Tax=Syphacia muris TaxID=451379 RepID=A0A158R572_9BILA